MITRSRSAIAVSGRGGVRGHAVSVTVSVARSLIGASRCTVSDRGQQSAVAVTGHWSPDHWCDH
ncbi:hypothetical protein HPP92_008084 [Vanilla planifolia]|uniref:Uncharacterized protein n=1 Tax=Vanilla planifolia TaxID=51239 RepID=A0A835RBX4_VANPL|nr:hypothetical protein HPP92_008251 [Vanilla planifolia]KAG0491221.1 hypothetical protein HPP92_008084 [Vanilla planifolia]